MSKSNYNHFTEYIDKLCRLKNFKITDTVDVIVNANDEVVYVRGNEKDWNWATCEYLALDDGGVQHSLELGEWEQFKIELETLLNVLNKQSDNHFAASYSCGK